MVNSRDKGTRGEREFAELCRQHGYGNSRRGQQYSGIEGEDVVGLPGVHVEVKRVEALNIEKAMAQSTRDAGNEKIPIVAHRKNRHNWLITMPAEKWFEFYKAWEARHFGKSQLQDKLAEVKAKCRACRYAVLTREERQALGGEDPCMTCDDFRNWPPRSE